MEFNTNFYYNGENPQELRSAQEQLELKKTLKETLQTLLLGARDILYTEKNNKFSEFPIFEEIRSLINKTGLEGDEGFRDILIALDHLKETDIEDFTDAIGKAIRQLKNVY